MIFKLMKLQNVLLDIIFLNIVCKIKKKVLCVPSVWKVSAKKRKKNNSNGPTPALEGVERTQLVFIWGKWCNTDSTDGVHRTEART